MTKTIRRVVCTGLGLVSPLGIGVKESWSALLQSKTGVSKLKEEHSYEGGQSRVAAYVPEEQIKAILNHPKHDYLIKNAKQLSRATTFAMLAAQEALEDANLLDENDQLLSEYRSTCGVAVGQGMVDFQDIYENASLLSTKPNGYRKISPFFMTRALINMSAGNISIRYKTHGPNHCVSTACASGAHSIGDAFNLIRNSDRTNIVICGSTEASINSLAMAGFERLRALCTKYNHNPSGASRPFDKDRSGFVMGEGAGIVILEELEHAKARGIKDDEIYSELLGYGMSSDSHHLTAPMPDGGGAKKCMISAIEDAKVDISKISHINAHATSTPLGDDIECNAIEDIFYRDTQEGDSRSNKITVTSCKSSIGHLLGAAGSVESIFAMQSCYNSLLPHCMNLDSPLTTSRGLIKLIQHRPLSWDCDKRVLVKNSFGFGGTNASLVIANYSA